VLRLLKNKLISFLQTSEEVARGTAVKTIETELEELEHIFGILVLGSYVGMPSPPVHISLDLMPEMERELIMMMEKIDTANEPLAQLFSTLDIG
jgi:hypothetical protein